MTLKEAREALLAKSKAIQAIHDEAGPDLDFSKVKSLEGDTKGKVEKLQAMNKELCDLKDSYDAMVKLDEGAKMARGINTTIGKEPDGPVKTAEKPAIKTLGDAFVESKAGSDLKGRDVFVPDINLKTLMERSAGWDPFVDRIPRVVDYAMRPLIVTDFIPKYTTGRDTIKYMKTTTRTNNAAEAAEGGVYGEAALALTEYSDEVEKLAVWLPVTDEQLEDVDGIGDWLNVQLRRMILERLDSQVLTGNGSTPNLWGAFNLSSVQSQAKGSYSIPDAIHLGLTKVRVTGRAEPSVIFMHPNDWEGVRLLTTADGIYIFGSPNDAGPTRLWGVPVAQTTACTEHTALIGDFVGYSGLFIKRGLSFKVSDSHDTYFIYGKQAIRCDMRCAMVYFRDEAFCKVTGI